MAVPRERAECKPQVAQVRAPHHARGLPCLILRYPCLSPLTSSPSTGAPRLFIATRIWCVRPVSGFSKNARSAGPRCCCRRSPSACCSPACCSPACCPAALWAAPCCCCSCCCSGDAACASSAAANASSSAAPSQAQEVKRVTAGKAALRVSSQLPRRPFCRHGGRRGGCGRARLGAVGCRQVKASRTQARHMS